MVLLYRNSLWIFILVAWLQLLFNSVFKHGC
nr:MAG TPA: hypothetical protein [Caudoviricetes sp.]